LTPWLLGLAVEVLLATVAVVTLGNFKK